MKKTYEEEVLRLKAMEENERRLRAEGYMLIAGVDEAGRGPLAGPVYAAAVILPEGCIIEGLNDSKKLSEKKREQLYDIICEKAVGYSIRSVDEKIIDEINILNATFLAMNTAVRELVPEPEFVLVDGNRINNMIYPCETIVGGDSKSINIAAASVLAKVSRDRYVKAISEKYPQYNFAKHKGYGTKEHVEAIRKYGPCEIHRKTFLKKITGGVI
ncbi:MAG: ribonuclease HII [Clostridia bacterium]|nr:ribonuclease HII [Clostridia bacterium]